MRLHGNKKSVSVDDNEIRLIILAIKDYSKVASMLGDGQSEHECYNLIKKIGEGLF